MFKDVEQLKGYFSQDIQLFITDELFMNEFSLLIPINYVIQEKFPYWYLKGLEYMSVRVNYLDFLPEKLFPLTTTSFNISGEVPCTDHEQAKDLVEKLGSENIIFYKGNDTLSGNPSTMIKLSQNLKEHFILRKGSKWAELESILKRPPYFQHIST